MVHYTMPRNTMSYMRRNNTATVITHHITLVYTIFVHIFTRGVHVVFDVIMNNMAACAHFVSLVTIMFTAG